MNKVEKYILYVISASLLCSFIIVIIQERNNSIVVSLLLSAIVTLLIFNELFLITTKTKTLYIIISSCAVMLLTTALGFVNYGSIYQYFYLVVVFQIMRVFGFKISVFSLIIAISLRIYVLNYCIDSTQIIISTFIRDISLYVVGDIVFSLISYIFNQNNELLSIKEKLTTQNILMESTYDNLRIAYNDLEDYTIIKERNYLAREMHDTVGHTLTSTLVELEMCKILTSNDQELNKHLNNISEQVRKGLYELRTTVLKLKDNVNWKEEINILIERLIKNTGISITTYIDDMVSLDQNTLRCCYRIIQEGITNGLKHGHASAFIINMSSAQNIIKLAVIDNGKGCAGFNKGFGLTAMTERVNELGGTIDFENSVDGFSINAQLPILKRATEVDA